MVPISGGRLITKGFVILTVFYTVNDLFKLVVNFVNNLVARGVMLSVMKVKRLLFLALIT